jgi:hypothetical protein
MLCGKASLVFTNSNFPFTYKRGLHGKSLPLNQDSVNSAACLDITEPTNWSSADVFEAHRFMAFGGFFTTAKIFVTTMGNRPVLLTFVDDDMTFHQTEIDINTIEAVKIVDTTGAGDVFISGFLYAWYVKEIKNLRVCVRTAAGVAASKLKSLGGRGSSLLSESQVLELIEKETQASL